MAKTGILISVLVAGLFLPPFIVPIFVPWSGINCKHQDINIRTGQARHSRRLWFVKISERIEDTPLSLALQGEIVEVAAIKAWHRVNTFSPGLHHSPHYAFHGALYQAHQAKILRDLYGLDSRQRKGIARQILIEWQTTGSYFAAGDFLRRKTMELEGSQTTSSTTPTEGAPSVIH